MKEPVNHTNHISMTTTQDEVLLRFTALFDKKDKPDGVAGVSVAMSRQTFLQLREMINQIDQDENTSKD